MDSEKLPEKIRVSIGSAFLLGLAKGKMDVQPTTIYLLTHHLGKCTANCGFCAQSRTSTSRADMLSRVTWPSFPVEDVLQQLEITFEKQHVIKRICLQAMNYPNVFEHLLSLVKALSQFEIPISVSCHPLDIAQIQCLVEVGVDRLGIPLDVPTENLFTKVKGVLAGGPYLWKTHLQALIDAVQVLGKGKVSTHFIVGLGETDEELVTMMQRMIGIGVYPSLFAFTPILGTRLEMHSRPSIQRYRRIQLAQYLITQKHTRGNNMMFDNEGNLVNFGVDEKEIVKIIRLGTPFITSGCPGCNRPYYNERPGGPLYNFPRKPNRLEISKIEQLIQVNNIG